MNTDETTPEDMPENTGSNLLPSELALGQQGRTHIKDYERHSRSYDKTITAMHQDILGFGRVLLTGQEMYPSRKEFGYWIERRGLNTGRLAKHQTERTACMSLTRLVEDGVEIDEHDDSIVPVKLDLSGCKLTTPTDIMKWARKHHRHLFPHLPPKPERKPGEKIAGDIKRELAADIAARDERTAELEAELDEARARIAELEAKVADLREQLGIDDDDDDEEEASSGLTWVAIDGNWLASSGETHYEVKRPTSKSRKWDVVVYEGDATQGERLNKKPCATLDEAKAAAEAHSTNKPGA